jgi:2-polyprenyl-3-methyl-5-hydroxy-6-metoxy-1,4-benzoquinol methylase/ADP-ribose pyrophosphatase YjhB (NUDIX family)
MPQTILVWLLFEANGAVLLGKRSQAPFLGMWTLPGSALALHEAAEEAVARFARDNLGVSVSEEEFEETLYMSEGAENYVTNVFRVLGHDGQLRFRSGGAFEDIRYVPLADASDASAYPMPASLRAWLFQADEEGRPPGVGVPDNRAAWDTISAMYQAKHRLKTDAAHYGMRMPTENDLRLLGDVRGKRILEIGCGGGQCSIAFARQGAITTGIDQSKMQLAYARGLATDEGVAVDFLEGDITTLHQIKSESQDAVFSAHALTYVEDIDSCFGEVARVLRPGGLFVFSVIHPVRAMMSDEDRLRVQRPYWDVYQEWEWGADSGIWMRDWARTTEEWFVALRKAGFVVDRILEPKMLAQAQDESWGDVFPYEQGIVIPTTLIFRSVKP